MRTSVILPLRPASSVDSMVAPHYE